MRYSTGWTDPKWAFGTAKSDVNAVYLAKIKKQVASIPLDTLIDLWHAKFGTTCSVEQMHDDDFFSVVLRRLRADASKSFTLELNTVRNVYTLERNGNPGQQSTDSSNSQPCKVQDYPAQ